MREAHVSIIIPARKSERAQHSSGAMEELSRKVQKSKHPPSVKQYSRAHTCTATSQFKGQFKGAMDESSRTVEKASTHIEPDSSRRWCWSASPCQRCRVPRPASQKNERVTFQVQGGDGGNVADGSKCKHSHTAVPKSRARAQQSVSLRVSSMGQWMMTVQGMFKRQTHSLIPIVLRTQSTLSVQRGTGRSR